MIAGSLVIGDGRAVPFVSFAPDGTPLGDTLPSGPGSVTGVGFTRVPGVGYALAAANVITIYDTDFNVIDSHTLGVQLIGVASNYADAYYTFESNASVIYKLSATTGGILDTWDLSGETNLTDALFGVAPDDSVAYLGGTLDEVVTYDLVGAGGITGFLNGVDYAAASNEALRFLVQPDGSILFVHITSPGGPAPHCDVKLYSDAGVLLHTYPIPADGIDFINGITLGTTSASFWWKRWWVPSTVFRIEEVQLSDGSILNSFDADLGIDLDYNAAAMVTVPTTAASNQFAYHHIGTGAAVGASKQWAMLSGSGLTEFGVSDAWADQRYARQASSSYCAGRLARAATDDPDFSAQDAYAFVNFTDDGCVINRALNGIGGIYAVLLVKLPAVDVGTFSEPLAAGAQAVPTSVTFPKSVMVHTTQGPNTLTEASSVGMGASDGTTQWDVHLHGERGTEAEFQNGKETSFATVANTVASGTYYNDYDSSGGNGDPSSDEPRIGRAAQVNEVAGGDDVNQSDVIKFVSFGSSQVNFSWAFAGIAPVGYTRPDIRLYFICIGESLNIEDPCEIESAPEVFVVTQLGDGTPMTGANTPIREHSTWYGGYKPPYLIDIGEVVRTASDWRTGSPPVNSVNVVLADTNYHWRDAIVAADGNLLNARMLVHMISHASRKLGMDPAILFNGFVYDNPLSSQLKFTLVGNDVISSKFSILHEEVLIPQRPLEPDFPGYGYVNVQSVSQPQVVCASIIGGVVSDEDSDTWIPFQTAPHGQIPLLYAGSRVVADASTKHIGILAGHACGSIATAKLYQSDGSTPGTPPAGDPLSNMVEITDWGTTMWGPGKTGWSTVNPTGSALYTDVTGTDGVNRYTLYFFNVGSDIGDKFASGESPIYVNVDGGLEANGDGTGTPITRLLQLYKMVYRNFILQSYTTGAYPASPLYPYYPGAVELPLLDEASFDVADVISEAYVGGGFIGGFVLGAGGSQQSVRQVLSQFNVQSNVSSAINRFGQYFVRMFNPDRVEFVGDRTVEDHIGILSRPEFESPLQRELLASNLRFGWRSNYQTGRVHALDQIGDNPSFIRYDSILANSETYTLIQDDDTAQALALARLVYMGRPKRQPVWGQSLCGMRFDILDGLQLTHFNGPGPSGYSGNAMWIRVMGINPKTCATTFKAHDVENMYT